MSDYNWLLLLRLALRQYRISRFLELGYLKIDNCDICSCNLIYYNSVCGKIDCSENPVLALTSYCQFLFVVIYPPFCSRREFFRSPFVLVPIPMANGTQRKLETVLGERCYIHTFKSSNGDRSVTQRSRDYAHSLSFRFFCFPAIKLERLCVHLHCRSDRDLLHNGPCAAQWSVSPEVRGFYATRF